MNSIDLIRPQLDRLQKMGLPIGIAGLILAALGFVLAAIASSLPDFLQPLVGGKENGFKMALVSYLVSYMLVFGVSMGSLAWLLIHHVAGGGAFFLIRRLLEAGVKNLPLMALLFLPILLGVLAPMLGMPKGTLYEWADPSHVKGDKILEWKAPYLNVPFFLGRTATYFGLWLLIGGLLIKWGKMQLDGDKWAGHKLSMWSCVFLFTYVMTMTFASFDWVMSLTPHWFSSLFGVIFIVGQGLSTLCLMHVLITNLTKNTNLTDWVPQRYFRDLGNLTLAFTLLWAYMNFSQYVIIWSGNLGEEAEWYIPRTQTNWVFIGGFLIAFHFAFPFLTLLSSSVKVRIQNLAKLGLWILVMRWIDMNFFITATFATKLFGDNLMGNGTTGPQLGSVNWLVLLGSPIGLAGIWISMWARHMKAMPDLIAVDDPRFVGQVEVPPAPDARPVAVGAH